MPPSTYGKGEGILFLISYLTCMSPLHSPLLGKQERSQGKKEDPRQLLSDREYENWDEQKETWLFNISSVLKMDSVHGHYQIQMSDLLQPNPDQELSFSVCCLTRNLI